MDQASVKMIRDGRESSVLTNDIRKISLDLELQSVYTLSFFCPGYLTKALLFDTRHRINIAKVRAHTHGIEYKDTDIAFFSVLR